MYAQCVIREDKTLKKLCDQMVLLTTYLYQPLAYFVKSLTCFVVTLPYITRLILCEKLICCYKMMHTIYANVWADTKQVHNTK